MPNNNYLKNGERLQGTVMKKAIFLAFALLTAAIFSSCTAEKIRYADYVPGNNNFTGFPPIMETEYGYYSNNGGLIYNDKETGKCVYLCSKPECPHDGGDYCTATGGRWTEESFALSGNYIYFNAVDIVFSGERDETLFKLFRASLNGSELTEICTYYKFSGQSGALSLDSDDFDRGRQLVVHKNFAVVPYKSGSPEAPIYNTAIVNLETGAFEQLSDTDYKLSECRFGQFAYYPYGEWLYYTISPEKNIDTRKLYRYNFFTKQTEKLDISAQFSDFAVTGESVVYIQPAERNNSAEISSYDISSGEIERLLTLDEFTSPRMIYDNSYFIIWENENGLILDSSVNQLVELTLPRAFEQGSSFTALNSTCGKLYFRIDEEIFCCEISDIISENANWYEPYSFNDFQPVPYNFDHLF